MTEHTPPKSQIFWGPITEGIALDIDDQQFKLNLPDVVELWKDMEEARMQARGYEKIEEPVHLILDKDIIKVMGNDFRVASTFIELHSKYAGVWYCLQDDQGREIIWPAEDLVTAYRPVE